MIGGKGDQIIGSVQRQEVSKITKIESEYNKRGLIGICFYQGDDPIIDLKNKKIPIESTKV